VILLSKGAFQARLASSPEDLTSAQALRARAFGLAVPCDVDAFDEACEHILLEHCNSGTLVGCFRMMPLTGDRISASYSAQYYELSGLEAYDGKMVEMGRFCLHPNWPDPDILRLAWGAMTQYVDRDGVDLLFGCSSFAGTEPKGYLDAFAMLRDRQPRVCGASLICAKPWGQCRRFCGHI